MLVRQDKHSSVVTISRISGVIVKSLCTSLVMWACLKKWLNVKMSSRSWWQLFACSFACCKVVFEMVGDCSSGKWILDTCICMSVKYIIYQCTNVHCTYLQAQKNTHYSGAFFNHISCIPNTILQSVLQGCLTSSWSCVCFVVDLVDSPSLDFRIVFFREIVDFMQRVFGFFFVKESRSGPGVSPNCATNPWSLVHWVPRIWH